MKLMEILERIMTERDLAASTLGQYRNSIAEYTSFLKHEATEDDLTYDRLNAWLVSLKATHQPTTIRNKTKGISVCWNWYAFRFDRPSFDPRRTYKPKVVQKPVVSWTLEDFDILIQAAEKVDATFKGQEVKPLLLAWLNVGFDTAMRRSDLLKLDWSDIDLRRGKVCITQSKTRNVVNCNIGDKSREALKSVLARKSPKPIDVKPQQVRSILRHLFAEAAKLGFVRKPGQSLGMLRKLHATVQYEDYGIETAAESLGHRGGTRTVEKHYIDSKSRKSTPLPRRA